MKITKSQLKQIIKEELEDLLELGFGEGAPSGDEWSKKQNIVLEDEGLEEAEKTKVSKAGQKRVSRKIAHLIRDEGKPKDQAAAIAYSMESRGELK